MTEHVHSYGSYQRDLKRKAPICPGCRAIATQYHAKNRAARPARREYDRKQSASRHAAMLRLSQLFPAEFAQLLQQERRKVGLR